MKSLRFLIFSVAMVAATGGAMAAELTVTNPGFELPVTLGTNSDPWVDLGTIDGWDRLGGAHWAGVANAVNRVGGGTSLYVDGAADGNQHAFVTR